MMNPQVSELSEENNVLRFTLSNINVSLANALRRVILSEIPTIVFRTFPYERNKTNIIKNTTRMNNELIKQRLSCIPIIIDDIDFPIEDYQIEVDSKNESDITNFITTKDFKIKNKKTDTYLANNIRDEIFPADTITNEHIVLARTRPKLSSEIDGEHLKFISDLDIGIAKEDGAFNVVSTCCYKATEDKIKINKLWIDKEKQFKSQNIEAEELEVIKRDWYLLDAKRNYIPNSFMYTIETVGQYTNIKIVNKACNLMISKLEKFKNDVTSNEDLIKKSEVTIPNSYDIILINEDYTLGKVIEYILFYKHYEDNEISDKSITFCGFKKPHPHINESLIRIAFVEEIERAIIINYLTSAAEDAIKIYTKLQADFSS